MRMSSLPGRRLLLTALLLAPTLVEAGDSTVVALLDGDRITVKIDGELFTEYHFEGQNKPILYPVLGPGQVPMTRNYPMKQGVPNEASDHPHHRSLWFTHGDVNGISFWHEGKGAGVTVQEKLLRLSSGKRAVIQTSNRWVGPDGKTVMTDVRTLTFYEEDGARIVDHAITLRASEGPVKLGDTKEGTMGIRTNPLLRLRGDERRGVTEVNGRAINSAGHRDRELWGKRAAWVDYTGEIDGKTVGVAIFDHPANPRHPTWWHARDYGLVAANPFGIHDFERKPAGTGDLSLKKDEEITFRHRFVFHPGGPDEAHVKRRFARYTGE